MANLLYSDLPMKILCVIDSLGSGGAQRQLVNLACGLKERGHSVEAFVYYPRQDFFIDELKRSRIPVHSIEKRGRLGLGVLLGLIHLLRNGRHDVLISFLDTPNVYSIAASLFCPWLRVIVSERSSYHHDKSRLFAFVRRVLYAFSDRVVANSRTQAEWLRRYSWLKNKTVAIYNGFPIPQEKDISSDMPPPKFIVIGRVGPEKNGINLVRALCIFLERYGYAPEVSWVGREDNSAEGQKYVVELKALLRDSGEVGQRWTWLGERRDVALLLKEHRALIHPSLYEGLPNVVCEAFFEGRPVLASAVCDHPYLVGENERGCLFDPLDPESLCCAIAKFIEIDSKEWRAVADNARAYAVDHLSDIRMVEEYEKLLS